MDARQVAHYNLPMIMVVGFRVRSPDEVRSDSERRLQVLTVTAQSFSFSEIVRGEVHAELRAPVLGKAKR